MKKEFIYLYLFLASLLIVGVFFDKQIAISIANSRIPALNEFMIWASYGGTWFVVLIVMTSLFLWNERKRRWIIPLWLSIGISAIITKVIKMIILRDRPYVALGLELLSDANGSSFPSGHATAVFSTLAVLDKEFPRFKWFWLIFALLVAFSRIYLGVHYLSDVVVGGIIGLTAGLFTLYYWKKLKH